MRRDRVERLGVLIGDERGPRLATEQKERLEEFGFEQITAGTLYRALSGGLLLTDIEVESSTRKHPVKQRF